MEELYKKYNIDSSLLKRDYRINPLKMGIRGNNRIKPEIICEEDLKYLYINCNVRYYDMLKITGMNEDTFLKSLKLYNIKKPTKLKAKNEVSYLKEKYGDDYYYKRFNKINEDYKNKTGYDNPSKDTYIKN